MVTVMLCSHIMACLWYFSARFDSFHPDTWVIRHNYIDEDLATKYLVSLYWSISTMSTVGYGDINAYTTFEFVLSMIWMIYGV